MFVNVFLCPSTAADLTQAAIPAPTNLALRHGNLLGSLCTSDAQHPCIVATALRATEALHAANVTTKSTRLRSVLGEAHRTHTAAKLLVVATRTAP